MKKIALSVIIFLLVGTQLSAGFSVEKKVLEEKNIEIESISSLPSYFSWTDIDGVDYTTPVRDQRPYASCETFAYVAALETMVQYKIGFPFGCDLSEAHLYFWSGGNRDWGSYPENDTNFLVDCGVPDEACWPYPGNLDEPVVFPKNTTCNNWRKRTVKIKNWSYLPPNDINEIKKSLINNGPVPTHFHVYKDFNYYKKGVYRHLFGRSLGLHLVCIMGYKDDPSIPSGGYWIVKNSWGKEWGNNGWFNIAYGEGSIEEMPVLLKGVYGNFSIIYVDDDNTCGPWDGSIEHPYKSIQKAVDSAYTGWTVYVKNGTYEENIVINKTINLYGENKKETIIDGKSEKDVIYVHSKDVKISGFKILNSGEKRLDAGIKTLSLNSNLTVENCIVKNCDVGIYLNCMDFDSYPTSFNKIVNNTIIENNIGIFSLWVHNNIIKENTISNNRLFGIEFEANKFSNIEDNIFENNNDTAIYLHGSSNENKITKNKFRNNSVGINLKETKKTSINNNYFIDNEIHATFDQSIQNNWNNNYWSSSKGFLPYPIKGKVTNLGITWYNFDWTPLRKMI